MATINSLVVKIASRCNLNCDYCYMYQHADQSYKLQPMTMSNKSIEALSYQVSDYLRTSKAKKMGLSLHGGEPLLAGYDKILHFLRILSGRCGERVSFSIQTNGVLLNKKYLDLFRKFGVQVGLSLDGPQSANDKHRVDHKGRSTHFKVEKALKLLTNEYADIFSGILCVIDPTNDPKAIIDYFQQIQSIGYDLLLPDSTHFSPPPGRKDKPNLYKNWLCEAFSYWYTNYRNTDVRIFRNLCDAIRGDATESEIFGMDSVSYLVIETDGSYHYSDLLKVAYEGASSTGCSVHRNSIEEVICSAPIEKYASLAKLENQSKKCQKCPVHHICGGGLVTHRYGPEGFKNPTVYCEEMLSVIQRAKYHIYSSMITEFLSAPVEYENQLINAFFSSEAVYLMLALLGLALPRYVESFDQVMFHFGDVPGANIESYNHIKRGIELIGQIFPEILREVFFLSKGIEVLGCDSSSYTIECDHDRKPKKKIYVEDESDSVKLSMYIVEKYLDYKLETLSQHFSLFRDQSGTNRKQFKLIFLEAYKMRFLQILTFSYGYDKEKTYVLAKHNLVQYLTLVKLESLTSAGKKFINTIIEEFLPEKVGIDEH